LVKIAFIVAVDALGYRILIFLRHKPLIYIDN